MSRQISTKRSAQLTLNATRLQELVVDLNEPKEECLTGGKLENLQKLQEEFGPELSRSSSSGAGGPFFILIL
ncbi:MAG TPA: hypothetical protein DDZ80_27990 [Cyanobacteria bacterium UBA8803]|nr:hypothetical protein [Cyanobacteria bacterium UBA9273]HBL62106.1 hypothetical protein [Cyanobacteria bacterium UBA8803]